jgi:tetratricopeptide (TPR) repeat protein
MSSRDRPRDPARLQRNVLWALEHAFGPADVLPMLRDLANAATNGSTAWLFAQEKIAELEIERSPWRAAIAARAVLTYEPNCEIAHGYLGLALSLLGHSRAAIRSYRSAVRLAPKNARYLHNLGHLLDVFEGPSAEAIRLLRLAHRAEPEPEIAASLAHALARTGRVDEAREILVRALEGDEPSQTQRDLLAWINAGAR